jgi:hypothetical protein
MVSMFCIEDEEDDEDDEFMHMDLIAVSSNAMNPPRPDLDSIGILLLLGEGNDEVLSRFLIVEFQKFFISLSVRPGSRAAICDHLHQKFKIDATHGLDAS